MVKLIDLCKGRYPVGLFSFDKELWTDEGVKQAAKTGADFFMAVNSEEALLGLCEKYDLGVISNSKFQKAPLYGGITRWTSRIPRILNTSTKSAADKGSW